MSELVQKMAEVGIAPAELLKLDAESEVERFQVEGDRSGSKNGWIIWSKISPLKSIYSFGSWKTGSQGLFIEGDPSATISFEHREAITQARRLATLKKQQEQRQVAADCHQLWQQLPAAEIHHGYLNRKDIQPHIARACNDSLVIPIIDFNFELQSLQFIAPDGRKQFRKGGAIRGNFCPIGFGSFDDSDRWIVCEGFATGASIFECTGLPVLVAFNAGNLSAVCLQLRAKKPNDMIIIGADDDSGVINTGVAKAKEAAQAVRAVVLVPQLKNGKGDFNDLANEQGPQAVRNAFAPFSRREVAA